jgi:hypothetical protein
MHSALACLGKIHAECLRTDALAKAKGLRAVSSENGSFRWGYSDSFERPKNKKAGKPLRLTFTRDVFLVCDSSIYHDYDLGFEEEFDTDPDQIFLAYRLELSHRFNFDGNEETSHFPVTVFWEPAAGTWKGTARIRHGEHKHTPLVRPKEWTEALAEFGLDSLGELAEGIGRERAPELVSGMLELAARHVPGAKQYEETFGRVLRA